MHEVRVTLFGKVSVCQNERCLDAHIAAKAQELLAYLLVHRGQLHTRETIADRLWSDTLGVHSKKYLRQALWKLRAALEDPDVPKNEQLLIINGDWIQINAQADLQLDVAKFEQTYILTHALNGEDLDERSARMLWEAVDLYQGDLLDGWYYDWCIYERERFQSMLLFILDKLMAYCETNGTYERGIQYGLQILRYDRAREHTHRKLMRLYYLTGDRTGALRQFNLCETALAEELGVSPAKRTISLYKEICADHMDGAGQPDVVERQDTGVLSAQFAGMLSRFDQLEIMLADSQRELQQHIQSIETTLKQAPRS